MSQKELARKFHDLHVKGAPLILYNIWDAGTAIAAQKAGAKAVATGSAPVALANGFPDGEQMPLELALENFRRIAAAVDLPATMDFEGAYSADPETGARNIAKAVEAGAVGVNFEDQIVGGQGLHEISVQSTRIEAARKACDETGVPAFINARTDIFLKAKAAGNAPTAAMLDEAVKRAGAFADAGADGFFAPGLLDIEMITALCARVSLPVNIIALPGAPANSALAEAGVARISYGPVPWRRMIAWFEDEARSAMSGG